MASLQDPGSRGLRLLARGDEGVVHRPSLMENLSVISAKRAAWLARAGIQTRRPPRRAWKAKGHHDDVAATAPRPPTRSWTRLSLGGRERTIPGLLVADACLGKNAPPEAINGCRGVSASYGPHACCCLPLRGRWPQAGGGVIWSSTWYVVRGAWSRQRLERTERPDARLPQATCHRPLPALSDSPDEAGPAGRDPGSMQEEKPRLG